MSEAREVVEQFIQAAVSGDRAGMSAFFAPDAVIETPFMPPAYADPARQQAARERADSDDRGWRLNRADIVAIHETADPEVVISEYGVHGVLNSTQEEFDLGFVMVTRVRDGKIVHSRDYNNPLRVARLIGTTPNELEALYERA